MEDTRLFCSLEMPFIYVAGEMKACVALNPAKHSAAVGDPRTV